MLFLFQVPCHDLQSHGWGRHRCSRDRIGLENDRLPQDARVVNNRAQRIVTWRQRAEAAGLNNRCPAVYYNNSLVVANVRCPHRLLRMGAGCDTG